MEQKLAEYRAHTQDRLETEKNLAEKELDRVKTAEQHRIEEYRKSSDEKLERIRKQAMSDEAHLHEREKKIARRERELEGAKK
jgi:hypothetical protein